MEIHIIIHAFSDGMGDITLGFQLSNSLHVYEPSLFFVLDKQKDLSLFKTDTEKKQIDNTNQIICNQIKAIGNKATIIPFIDISNSKILYIVFNRNKWINAKNIISICEAGNRKYGITPNYVSLGFGKLDIGLFSYPNIITDEKNQFMCYFAHAASVVYFLITIDKLFKKEKEILIMGRCITQLLDIFENYNNIYKFLAKITSNKVILVDSLQELDFLQLLAKSCSPIGCTGDNSLAQVLSCGKLPMYEVLTHKQIFMQDLNDLFNKFINNNIITKLAINIYDKGTIYHSLNNKQLYNSLTSITSRDINTNDIDLHNTITILQNEIVPHIKKYFDAGKNLKHLIDNYLLTII